MDTPIHTHGFVLKALPSNFTPAVDGMWALATVEVPDADRDIVRIKGIDLSLHRTESPVKVFGTNHKYNIGADGTAPVMGVVQEFMPTTTQVKGSDVPALAFRFSWAKEGDGTTTPFAAKLKSLFDGGTLDSFSIGFYPKEVRPLKGGRYDVQSCSIYEISACAVPANPYAVVLKALQSTLGEDFDSNDFLEQRIVQLLKSVDGLTQIMKSNASRLDDIESAIVAGPEGTAKQASNRQSSQPDLVQLVKAVKDLDQRLAGVAGL